MLEIEPIERRVMQRLLAGDHPTLETLRQQFARSCVADRDFTGVGFFTRFEVPDSVPRVNTRSRIVIGDVCADVDGLQSGCGFILFVDDGLVGTLECHLWAMMHCLRMLGIIVCITSISPICEASRRQKNVTWKL
ncbi:MAG: hypothetical protein OSA89_19845 [Mariniblastus sp.]|nr:hypothetical protein [Mariniblastus sp.]